MFKNLFRKKKAKLQNQKLGYEVLKILENAINDEQEVGDKVNEVKKAVDEMPLINEPVHVDEKVGEKEPEKKMDFLKLDAEQIREIGKKNKPFVLDAIKRHNTETLSYLLERIYNSVASGELNFTYDIDWRGSIYPYTYDTGGKILTSYLKRELTKRGFQVTQIKNSEAGYLVTWDKPKNKK